MQRHKMIVVNMFGAPNAGKTAVASGLFSRLKVLGIEVDYVPELVRMAHYTNNASLLNDELALLADKNTRLTALAAGGIKVAITDGPVLASLVYRKQDYLPSFDSLVREVHASFDNINIFIPGVRNNFSLVGRGEASRNEADSRGFAINEMLRAEGQRIITLDPTRSMVDDAVHAVVSELQARMAYPQAALKRVP